MTSCVAQGAVIASSSLLSLLLPLSRWQARMVHCWPPVCFECRTIGLCCSTHFIPTVTVDCTEQRDLCERFGVQGFPTLKIFRNDGSEPQEYDGPRKADGIVKFMERYAY